MNIPVHIYKEPDGRYAAVFPTLPGCFTEGDTREELMHNIREAIECHLGEYDVTPDAQVGDAVEILKIPLQMSPDEQVMTRQF